MEDSFIIKLQAALDKMASKKQVNSDIKELQKSINILRLTATLMKGDSKKAINQVVRQMEGQLSQVKLKAKIDTKNLKSDVNKSLNNLSFDDINMNFDSNKTKLKAKKVIADIKKVIQSSPVSVNIEIKKNKLDNQLTTYLSKNSKIKESPNLINTADTLRENISQINDKDSLQNAIDHFQLFKSEVSATGYQAKSTTEKIQELIGKVTRIGAIFSVASMAIDKTKQSLQTIKENDTVLTEISKSSNMSSNELKKLGNISYQIASKYGKIASDYLTATQEMSRAGYKNAASMAELSVAAQVAGDMTADVANQYIIETDVAFKMNGSIEALTTALDGANGITNHNAVNMTELASGMSVVGSQAASSQMEVNEITAAIGTMVAATQESGWEMGNAFKGILMNLQQVSGDVGDGEDIIDTDSLTKYEKACTELGVSLSTVKNGIVSLKEPMQILKELSEKYTKLDESDTKRANLLNAVGGKYRANALNAILENYDMYSKMLDDYAQGTDSMSVESEKIANSLEGQLNALTNSWDNFISSLLNKNALRNGVSLFDGLINSAERLIDVFDVIPVVMAGVTAFKTAKDKDYGITKIFDQDTGKLDLEGSFMGINFTQFKHFKEASEAITAWNDELANGKINVEEFQNKTVQNTAQLREYLKTCSVDAPASLDGYKQSLKAAGVEVNSLRLGTVLLNTALSFGIGMAVQGVITGISKIASASNDIAEKAKKVGSSFNETKSDIESYKTKIKELQNTINDSSSSIADVTEARKNLITIQDELITKYGSETDTIHIVTDAINDQADALDNLNKKKYTEAKNEFNKEGFFENISNNFSGYSNNMDRMVSQMEEPVTLQLTTAYNRNMEEYKKFEKIISQYGAIETGNIHAGGSTTISLDGDLDTIYEKLLKIQETASYYDFGSDDFNGYLTDKINETKEKLDNYSDLYNNYVLYDKILSDSGEKNGYDETFKSLTDAYNQYKEADSSGGSDKIEQAQNDYAKLITEAAKNIKDDSVIEYFRNMYPELQEIVGSWQFNLDFSQNTENIKTDVQDTLGQLNKDGFTVESLVDFKRETATEEQIQNYSILDAVATKYGMTIDQLISLLESMGLVQNESYKQLASKFGEENVKSLSNEEIEIAYTIKSTDGMTFDQLKEKIKEVQDSAQDTSPISFSKAWNALGSESDEDTAKASEEAKEKLLELAEAGKLTIETFKDTSIAEQFMKDTGLSAKEATLKINEMKSSADQLASMKTGISSISTILSEKKDNLSSKSTYNEGIEIDTLAGMPDDVKAQKKEYKNFVEVLGNGASTMDKCQNAANKLATAYVSSNNFLANLTKGTEDYYTSVLTEMGIENAGTLVANIVTSNKEKQKLRTEALAAATKDMADKTSNASEAFVKEANMSNLAKVQLADLVAKEEIYNSTNLSTADKVKELNKLALAYFGVSNAIQISSAMGGDSRYWNNPEDYEKAIQKQWNKLIKKQTKLSIGSVEVDKDKNQDKSNKKEKKSSTKKTKTEIDWLSRRLTRMQSIIDLTASKLQNLFNVKAKNKNLNKQIKQTSALIEEYSIAAKTYQQKADKISSGSSEKTKQLSKDIINKVKSGKITKSSYDKLVKEYGQSKADRINKYIDYYDKAQDARKNKQDTKAKARELKKQKLQNWVDLYDSRIARAEAKTNIQTNAKDKNKTIDTQIKNINNSYTKQIKIAGKLSKDKAEADRLKYEKQQKIKELQEQKLQNYVDEYDALADLAAANADNAIGYERQNSYINTQLSYLGKSYAKQIEIAKLNGDITEEKRLQAEYKAKNVELQQQQVDNIKTDYENKIGFINNGKQDLDNTLAETEARGGIVQASFYSSLNSYENQMLGELKSELAKLNEQQKTFTEYSPQWYNLQSDIQSVENSISEANISIIENNKKMGELRQAMYDDIAARNSETSSEAQFLAGLLGDNLTDDKTGNLTKDGLGVLGTYGIELEANTNTALSYKKNREEIEKSISDFNSGNANALDKYGSLKAAKETLNDVIQKQQEAISAEYDSMKNIYDLMVQKYDTQLSYMKSIIDAKKQVLDMEKDLYDYEKNISSQTKNIAALEKQLTALKGDDSEEGRAKRAKLLVSLDEANRDLQDTEYERYISDQENMLDNMYDQYEDLLCVLEKDFETVIKDGVNTINGTASGISNTLNNIAQNYGYNPSDKMKDILDTMQSGDDDVIKTLPDTIQHGMSEVGKVFQSGADDTTNDYNKNQTSGNSSSGSSVSGGNTAITPTVQGGTPDRNAIIEQAKIDAEKERENLLNAARVFIGAKAKTAKKKRSEYSYVNQKIFDTTNGRVLSTENLKDLAKKTLKVPYDNAGENGSLATKLKEIKYTGFRTGGIVRANGVPKDGDNVPVMVNPDETILTQDFTKLLPDSVDAMKHFIYATDYSKLMKPQATGSHFGNIIVTAELPNVANAQDFVSEFQNSKRIQKAFEIGVRDCLSHGRITNNIQNII